MKKIITNSEKETFELAGKIASKFKEGDIVALIGELGAGKTAFVKGIAKKLGVKRQVSSPTFLLMKIYSTNDKKIKKIAHVDAYRIKKAQDLTDIGLQEYFGRSKTITVIEWADRIKKILPKEAIYVYFKHKDKNKRVIASDILF